jgi:hypothetical protein
MTLFKYHYNLLLWVCTVLDIRDGETPIAFPPGRGQTRRSLELLYCFHDFHPSQTPASPIFT